MRRHEIIVGILSFFAAASIVEAASADDVRHFSFAYDQPHTTAYGIAGDTFAAKLAELSHNTMIIDQFPGAQLGQEPQVLQKRLATFETAAAQPPQDEGCWMMA